MTKGLFFQGIRVEEWRNVSEELKQLLDFTNRRYVRNIDFKELRESVAKQYQELVNKTTEKFLRDAQTNLDKPDWLLSKYLKKKEKLYKNGAYAFGVSGVFKATSGKETNKRLPGYYWRYHEHGYVMNLDKASKKRQLKNKRRVKKKGKAKNHGYQMMQAKKFFRKAFNDNTKEFYEKINRLNHKIILQMTQLKK